MKRILEIEGGERVVDFKDNPLHIVSYSLPVDKTLSFEELQPHLYFNEKRPHTIPWVFKYYDRDWGFCLPKNVFDKLPRDKKYRAVIKSEFITDPKQGFKMATAVIHPEGGAESRSRGDHRAGAYLSPHAGQRRWRGRGQHDRAGAAAG